MHTEFQSETQKRKIWR